MASSQVEIVSLRSSFGCVLRDRNQRNNDDGVVFKKNLKAQVKTAPAAIADENSQNRVDSWIGNKPRKNNKTRLGSPEKPRTRKENNFSGSEKKNDHFGGASSLVQIWEARLIRSNGGNSPIHGQSTESSSSGASVQDIDLSAPESESENESKNPDPAVEIESETLKTVSDSGESKWGRVAEMIRRLSNEQKLTVGVVDKPIVQTSTPEKSSFPVVTSSPRLRGRQAYSDLLVRLERDRHRELESLLERNAVSKFPQRGRLQSMLRLRSLKRGLAIQDRHRGSVKDDVTRVEPGSTVLHLREKFRENAANAAAEAERRKGQQSTVETESMRSKEISIPQETSSTERLSLSPRNRKIEDAILRKKEIESKMSYLQLKETIVTEPQILEKEEAEKVETPFLEKEETLFANEWEDQEEYEDEQSYYGDMSYDWFTEISRPRTYWEDLRKSRYLEVMNTRSDKDDICRLLERRTVSDFLQSGLRETIDKLIMSRVQPHPVQLKTHQRIEEAVKEEEKCDIGEEEDEHRDDLSQTSSQIFLPSPAGSWSSQDTGVTSTPVHSLQSSEMEMISDMRSQILQLQLEMSELRDSVKTCLDVNASLQKSAHRENPLKRKCCVCNESLVETLLYRCGHMCTCLRCANDLQCNGGKCPICRAKILDVVRIFVDSRT